MMRSLALAALAATAIALPAHADVLNVHLNGTVDSQTGTAYTSGQSLSGDLRFDTVTGNVLSFMIGGSAVPAGFATSMAFTPDRFSALYQAQISPVPGGTVNRSFTLDLEGLAAWAATSPAALLADDAAINANLDSTLSSFGYYMATAAGTDVHSVSALLDSVQVSAVPEPGSVSLVLASLLALGAVRRRASQAR